MNREEIKRTIIEILKPLGVRRIALFGSYARGDIKAHDVDILVEFFPAARRKKIGFRWFTLDQEISQKIGMPVDLVSEAGMSSALRAEMEKDLDIIYEEAG